MFISKYIRWILPFSIIFMHMTFFHYDTFPINISLISAIFFVILCGLSAKISLRHLAIFFTLISVILIGSLWTTNFTEFTKSYIQLVVLLLVLLVALGVPVKLLHNNETTSRNLIYFGLVSAGLIVSQAVLWNTVSVDWLAAPFGIFSPNGPGNIVYMPTELMEYARPNGIYSEPSVAGWMMAYLAAIAWVERHRATNSKLLKSYYPFFIFSLAALITGSLSGILNVFTIWLVIGLSMTIRVKFWKKNIGPVFFLAILSVGVVSYLSTSNYFHQRIETANAPGTSIYYRVIAPSLLVHDSLLEYPLGHPLGQIDYVESKWYMVNWAGGSQTNIDNSAFLIAYYFGWPGVVALIFGGWRVLLTVLQSSIISPIVVAQVMALGATGALWAPYMVLMIGFTVMLCRSWAARNELPRSVLRWL